MGGRVAASSTPARNTMASVSYLLISFHLILLARASASKRAGSVRPRASLSILDSDWRDLARLIEREADVSAVVLMSQSTNAEWQQQRAARLRSRLERDR